MAAYARQSLFLSSHSFDQIPILNDHQFKQEKPAVVQVAEINNQHNYINKSPSINDENDEEEDETESSKLALDQFFAVCAKHTPLVKAIVLSLITGIPFTTFLLITLFALPPKTRIGPAGSHATIFELAKWLFISWASFIGLLLSGKILASFFSWCCTKSKAWVKYQRLAEAVCLRTVLMVWALVCYVLIPKIFHHSLGTDADVNNWVGQLQKIFKFVSIAFAVLIIQAFVLELASVRYIQGWMGPRSQQAFDELDTIKRLHSLIKPHKGLMMNIYKKLFRPSDDTNLYDKILRGEATSKQWRQYAGILWNNIRHGRDRVTKDDIIHRLRKMRRGDDIANRLFKQLDMSEDRFVNHMEVEALVFRVAQQLKKRAIAQRGIKMLLKKLEILLTIVMLGVIAFIYILFFQQKYLANLSGLWTGLTGLSFAFGGVVLDFVTACTFVFGKHPYDVGDYVEIKGKKLMVHKIHLTYSNFEEVTCEGERGIVVQMSHASLLVDPITNWTRTSPKVNEQKKLNAEAADAEEKRKTAYEDLQKSEARELVWLKTELLKSKLE